ncbi:LuxR C-terminal-related transcriptional regulator [Streptomyces sp. NPDC008121]|uniref:helix-turn-helix transcriptional regulator n=1 Tax=Streptomyces sp. NPDC008121 TaxID=3364809 RepID=UPI0036EE7D80
MTDHHRLGPEGSVDLLPVADVDRLLAVVADCHSARTLPELGARLTESLAGRLEFRSAAVLSGDTRPRLFRDATAQASGLAVPTMDPYREHFHRLDPIALAASGPYGRAADRPLTLLDVAPLLAGERRSYVDDFLRPAGIGAVMAKSWACPDRGIVFGVALFDEDEHAFGARETTLLGSLGPALLRVAAGLLDARPPWAGLLTPRETEAVALLSEGLTDEQIAGRMVVDVGTAKKHLAAARRKSGAPNRVALARAWAG